MKGRRLLDAMAYIDDDLIEDAAFFAENDNGKAVRFFEKRARRRQLAACAAVLFMAVVSLWVWKSGLKVYEEIEPEENNAAADIRGENADSGGIYDLEAANQADVLADDTANKEGALTEGAADTEHEKGSLRVRIIEEFEQNSIACYAAPDKGEFFQSVGLTAAIDCWDNGNNTMDIAEPESYLYRVKIDVFGDVEKGNDVSYEVLDISYGGKEKLNKEYERLLAKGLDVSLSEEFELSGLLSRDEIEGFEPSPEYGYMFRLIKEPY